MLIDMRARTAVDGRPGGVVTAIARVEARRLLRHPVILVGTLMSAFLYQAYDDTSFEYYLQLAGDGQLLLCVAAVVAGALAGSRVRRDRAGELVSTQPAGDAGRVGGMLVAQAALVLPALVVLAVHLVRVPALTEQWRPSTVELAIGPVLVVASGVYGVMAGRWFPHVMAGPLAVLAMVLAHATVDVSNPPFAWFGWLMPFLAPRRAVVLIRDATAQRLAIWHLVYVGGLIGCGAAAALVRTERRRPVWALAAVSAVVAGVAAVMQVP